MDYYRYEGHLNPVPPYEFEHSRRFVRQCYPGAIQTDIDHTLSFPLALADLCLLITLRSRGKVESPLLMMTIISARELSESQIEQVQANVRFLLSLDEDIQPLYTLGWDDDPFADILENWYGYHQVKFVEPFAAACFALFLQECGLEQGKALWLTLLQKLGPRLDIDNNIWQAFPSFTTFVTQKRADILDLLRDEDLTGRFQQLTNTFIEAQIVANENDTLATAEWVARHTPLEQKAVQFLLIRGWGRYDQLIMTPADLLNLAQTVYGSEMQLEQLRDRVTHYEGWQGSWYHYLQLNKLN